MATFSPVKTRVPGTTLLDRIGNTPLVRFERIAAHLPGVQILGKAEWTNPGGRPGDVDEVGRGDARHDIGERHRQHRRHSAHDGSGSYR